MATGAVVVSGTGLVCPAAASVPELLAAGTNGRSPAGGSGQCGAWFDTENYLGTHGWKYLTPATRYLLAATGLALADAGVDPGLQAPETMGVVIGTNFAAHTVVARMDRVVIDRGAAELSPAEAPNFSVNIPASQVSMRWSMRAFNLSLTNPLVAGVESLLTLASAVRRGRARLGIAGAVEQHPGNDVHPAASEGACCFTAELLPDVRRRGGAARAEVAGGFSRFLPAGLADRYSGLGQPFDVLADATRSGSLPYVSVSGRSTSGQSTSGQSTSGQSTSGQELDAFCAGRFARVGIGLVRHEYLGINGEHFTVSAMLQVAGLIAEHGGGLVVATSPHGHVAAVLLRPVPL
jgi:hypothetical protein